ncbi:PQQ-dependent sugar dehydrogenase [Cohnella suwonensis]|uniref:PQQ-dependent sugar dehydrogenase n=1 Tax=Cohnella suwonensis TaxID=696072 RepID=A0ABW0LYW0_9BACL
MGANGRRRAGLVLSMAAIGLSLISCRGENETPAPEQSPARAEKTATVTLANVFEGESFERPVGLETRKGYEDVVYVVEQPGRVLAKNLKRPTEPATVALDIRDRVNDEGNEQGLLGLAFHPDRPNEAYANYTTKTHTVIARYVADPANPERLEPAGERVILTFEQPYENHNGGQLAFGPDGYLYIATGDGGSAGDPRNNGQNLDSLLGKILRIDVDAATGGLPYAIPPDNPFVGNGAPEIYAYGLRNPWRFSFDGETGRLWAADVGQERFEEINVIEKGGNYGWRVREGYECYKPASGCAREGLIDPVYDYDHEMGISVTGGYAYRGDELPSELVGSYFYADYGTGTMWALSIGEDGRVSNRTLMETGENVTSFGQDADGELYVCTQDGRILKLAS